MFDYLNYFKSNCDYLLKFVLLSIILIIFISIPSMNSIYLITNPVETNKTLLSHCTQSRELRFANRIIGPIVLLLIPYVIMVSLNTKVIFKLRESKRRVALKYANIKFAQKNRTTTNKGVRFTISTILIDLIFLIFNSPLVILSLYEFAIKENPNYYIFKSALSFANSVSLSYSAVLVLVFFIFNRIFRKELIARLEKIIHLISTRAVNSNTNIELINMH